MPWLTSWSYLLLFIILRYLIIAGIAFLICYVLLKKWILPGKIQQRFPKNADYRREILYSCCTMAIFSVVAYIFYFTPARNITQLYKDPAQYGMVWYVLAFPVMFFIHDAYFYWTHRLMHHPKLFKLFHLVHHRSTNPSPWASFAFHPLEAIVEAGIFPILLILLPLTPLHFVIFYIIMMFYNVYGHLGWELYPKKLNRTWVGRYVNTSFSHNQHHQFFTGNYGLYFLWWDRWMGTLRKDYEPKYEA